MYCYLIKYTYPNSEAAKNFHFVEAENQRQALEKAIHYINRLLSARFGKDTSFEIEDISEVTG